MSSCIYMISCIPYDKFQSRAPTIFHNNSLKNQLHRMTLWIKKSIIKSAISTPKQCRSPKRIERMEGAVQRFACSAGGRVEVSKCRAVLGTAFAGDRAVQSSVSWSARPQVAQTERSGVQRLDGFWLSADARDRRFGKIIQNSRRVCTRIFF